MLNCNNGRLAEFLNDLERRISVINIIVGKLFAMKLFSCSNVASNRIRLAVERCTLMRIFSVAKILHFS